TRGAILAIGVRSRFSPCGVRRFCVGTRTFVDIRADLWDAMDCISRAVPNATSRRTMALRHDSVCLADIGPDRSAVLSCRNGHDVRALRCLAANVPPGLVGSVAGILAEPHCQFSRVLAAHAVDLLVIGGGII